MYDELILRLRKDAEFLEISSKYNNTVNEFAERISQAADAIEELNKERKKGEWLEDYDGFEFIYRCSNCSEKPLTKYGTMHDYVFSEFCPHCGADMRGET